MAFKITISDIDQVFQKCIQSVVFRVDSPNDSNARATEIGNIIEIFGKIDSDEATADLYLWSLLPVNDPKAYRNVEVETTGAKGNFIRKVTFPEAFVLDYAESYSVHEGEGTFYLLIKQKLDKNSNIVVEGEKEQDY
jgi:hypothetical protein